MMEHGLVIIYIIYFILDLTNSLYDEVDILFAFSCKLSYLIFNLFYKKSLKKFLFVGNILFIDCIFCTVAKSVFIFFY